MIVRDRDRSFVLGHVTSWHVEYSCGVRYFVVHLGSDNVAFQYPDGEAIEKFLVAHLGPVVADPILNPDAPPWSATATNPEGS